MNRLFGKKKEEPPPPNLGDVGVKIDGRVTNLDAKINQLDEELKKYKQQLKTAKGPAAANIKRRAIQTLKRKKMFEQQRDSLAAQSFNIEQTSFALDTVKDTIETASALKGAAATMKQEYAKVNLDAIEDVQDDLADMMEEMNEIQDVMARTYGMDEIDEDELEAELGMLEDELEFEEEAEATPSYLAPAGRSSATDLPSVPSAIPSRASEPTVDEFGLPVAPMSGH